MTLPQGLALMSIYHNIKLKRVYEAPCISDGLRLLADRLWPRGLSKNTFQYDDWIKNLCPSHELRTAWHHGKISYSEFRAAYSHELSLHRKSLESLAIKALESSVTLLTAARQVNRSHLNILRDAIIETAEELFPSNKDRASKTCYNKDEHQ